MVTPFTADGGLDLAGAERLAAHLVDSGNDCVVVNGTTGESPTTSDAEKEQLLRTVVAAVDGRATVVAGVGTNDTAHTVELARTAERVGAHGLLVVTPYYSRPPQEALYRHFTTVADATGLECMVYDIPARTGTEVTSETLLRLAEHPRITAVKDAKDDVAASSAVLARTDLAYYSGTDALNLPLLAVGATGFVSVVGHLVGAELRQLLDSFTNGDPVKARELNQRLVPVYEGIFRAPGVVLVKAALRLLGLPGGPVRAPLIDADAAQIERLVRDLRAGGLPGLA